MNNIIIEKVWQEDNLIELKITAISKFATAYQNCYIQNSDLNDISQKMVSFINDTENNCYLEMGNKEGKYTPAFSMNIEKADKCGHVKIEVDIEIDDNDTRKHRCSFYVESELGAIERLGLRLNKLITPELWTKIELNA